jgi:hypothetical protein
MAGDTSRAAGGRRPETGEVRPIGDDLLRGAKEIADFLGMKPRQVYRACSETPDGTPHIPHFKVGAAIYARKSKLIEWIEEQERKAG